MTEQFHEQKIKEITILLHGCVLFFSIGGLITIFGSFLQIQEYMILGVILIVIGLMLGTLMIFPAVEGICKSNQENK